METAPPAGPSIWEIWAVQKRVTPTDADASTAPAPGSPIQPQKTQKPT